MICINYLPHNRKDFQKYWEITSHYLNKIKPANKSKIFLNILASHEHEWVPQISGIKTNVQVFRGEQNYMQKIHSAISSGHPYSIKLDEDCFINNHIWDYLIENIDFLSDREHFIISSILSNNIPLTERFIDGFIEDNKLRDDIHTAFINQEMPNGLWGVDYSPLNRFTINSSKWDSDSFFNAVAELDSHTKGIHPVRISATAQVLINKYIEQNLSSLEKKRDYKFTEFSEPYFTTSFFAIKTQDWINLVNTPSLDAFDEIQLNLFRKTNSLKSFYIENSFSIHTSFNTIWGNKNKWNIGMDDGEAWELDFIKKILEFINSNK